jgi:hypothetical protein
LVRVKPGTSSCASMTRQRTSASGRSLSMHITLKVVPNLMVICSPTAVPASQDEQGRLCSSLYLSSQDLG